MSTRELRLTSQSLFGKQFQAPEKSLNLPLANYTNVRLKVADKAHQNDLEVRLKTCFPKSMDVLKNFFREYRCSKPDQTLQVSPEDTVKGISERSQQDNANKNGKHQTEQQAKLSITNTSYHYHRTYTAYQPIEETVVKILIGQLPFRNAFPQCGNVAISIDNTSTVTGRKKTKQFYPLFKPITKKP